MQQLKAALWRIQVWAQALSATWTRTTPKYDAVLSNEDVAKRATSIVEVVGMCSTAVSKRVQDLVLADNMEMHSLGNRDCELAEPLIALKNALSNECKR